MRLLNSFRSHSFGRKLFLHIELLYRESTWTATRASHLLVIDRNIQHHFRLVFHRKPWQSHDSGTSLILVKITGQLLYRFRETITE